MPQKVYTVTVSLPQLNTLGKFLALDNSVANRYIDNADGFLAIVGDDGFTNADNILKSFNKREILELVGIKILYIDTENQPQIRDNINVPIKTGTVFNLEYGKINEPYFLTEGINIVSFSDSAFKAAALARLEGEKGYKAVTKPLAGKLQYGNYKEIYPNITVWIWCRSLSPATDEGGELSGQLMDLTPFIQKCSMNTGKNGSNFNILLPPITCEIDENNKWTLKKSNITLSKGGSEYLAQSSLFSADYTNDKGGALSKNNFFFHTAIRPNDLVFLRYEVLEMEQKQRYDDSRTFYLSKANLPERIYDMIGLIDSNSETINPQGNDVQININGRDLSKLLLDDGCYFFPIESSKGMVRLAGGSQKQNDLLQRIFSNNGAFINLYSYKHIDYIIKFVIQQLSSIKIVPNDLFSAYGDRRNTKYEQQLFTDNTSTNDKQREQLKNDSLQAIATLRNNVGLSDYSQSQAEKAKQNEVFDKLVSFFSEIKNDGSRFVDKGTGKIGWNDTTFEGKAILSNHYPDYFKENLFKIGGDVPNLAARLNSNVDTFISLENKSGYTKPFEKVLANGIWQIIDLVVDKNVSDRITADSSMSTKQGSLINYIRTACAEPLCEFYMDTVGDRFVLTCRKPPTDQSSLISLIEGNPDTENGTPANAPAIIDIAADDVLQANLVMNDQECYSWFHFLPSLGLLGHSNESTMSILPAVFFKEYADVFGSRPFQQTHPYIPFEYKQDNEQDYALKQATQDLKYVIESNQYLPFTRKGRIAINGDRRIKIGNIIRYAPTGEIFTVDTVQQDFQINENQIERTTTILVSRGMVESLIYGVHLTAEDGTRKFVSYFNCVNTMLNYEKVRRTVKKTVKKAKTKTVVVPNEPSVSEILQQDAAYFNFTAQLEGNALNNPEMVMNAAFLRDYSTYKPTFIRFINKITSMGFKVTITDGLRPYWRQVKEFEKNPARYNYKKPTPNAPHVKGAGMDLNLLSGTGESYTSKRSVVEWNATGIPALAKSMGLKWGGDFSVSDVVHFQIGNEGEASTKTITQTVMEEENVDTEVYSMDEQAVFKNFKVNPFTFNFFLKNLQFKPEFRQVKSRQVFETDQEGSLPTVFVTGKNKKQ